MIYYLVWFFIVVIYSPVFYQLYQSRWETIDYTHAYFILPVALWIVWQKRKSLRDIFLASDTAVSGKPSDNTKDRDSVRLRFHLSDITSLAVVLIGLVMFMLGWRQNYLIISSLSLIPVLWGTTRYLYDSAIARSLSFPIWYLLFLMPPPLGILDKVTMPMRYGISQVTEVILSLLNYPIERSGLLLNIDGNEIFMGAPCSGFRSLITMFALAVTYVYFIKGNFQKKLILIPSAIPFALLGNLVRVMTLCLITFYAGPSAEASFHDFSGILIFLIMIGCLMGLDHIIDKFQKVRSIS